MASHADAQEWTAPAGGAEHRPTRTPAAERHLYGPRVDWLLLGGSSLFIRNRTGAMSMVMAWCYTSSVSREESSCREGSIDTRSSAAQQGRALTLELRWLALETLGRRGKLEPPHAAED